jgi:hypothetical protein
LAGLTRIGVWKRFPGSDTVPKAGFINRKTCRPSSRSNHRGIIALVDKHTGVPLRLFLRDDPDAEILRVDDAAGDALLARAVPDRAQNRANTPMHFFMRANLSG